MKRRIFTSAILAYLILIIPCVFSGCEDDEGKSNRPPVATSQSLVTSNLAQLDVRLEAVDPDGDPLLWIIESEPEHGALVGIAPELVYVTDTAYDGSDSFTFHVNDGIFDSNSASVIVKVSAYDPVAYNMRLDMDEDIPIEITLAASDPDLDELSWALDTEPEHGAVEILSGIIDGGVPQLLYTPDSEYSGSDSFAFHVSDGITDSNTAKVEITVNLVNDLPVALDQSVALDEDTAAAVILTAYDVENDELTWQYSQPQHGSLVGDAPNLTYTPNPDYCGEDSFTFYVNDGACKDSNTATVSLAVTGVYDRWYVDAAASGGGDGKLWDTAFQHPMDAMDIAGEEDEVWVKAGEYMRRSGEDTVLLAMKDGAEVYGGFSGEETIIDDRNLEISVTTLDGNDEVYHVVLGANDARLDGFTITGGNAKSGTSSNMDKGGGMLNNQNSDITVANCAFTGNAADSIFGDGAGMYNLGVKEDEGYVPPEIIDCVFEYNLSEHGRGGGMCNNNYCSPMISGCRFSYNTADRGGGMSNIHGSHPDVIDCIFGHNTAKAHGGGMNNEDNSIPELDERIHVTGCVFHNNEATRQGCSINTGGAIYNKVSSITVTDCAFYSNRADMVGGNASCIFNKNESIVVCEVIVTVTSCAFWDNSSYRGGTIANGTNCALTVTNCAFTGNTVLLGSSFAGILNEIGGSVTVTNSILWNESEDEVSGLVDITYSNVEGGYEGEGNIDEDPLFADAADGDLRLLPDSPCIDMADFRAAPEFDMGGNPRVDDPGTPNPNPPLSGHGSPWPDMGVYEYQGE